MGMPGEGDAGNMGRGVARNLLGREGGTYEGLEVRQGLIHLKKRK